MSTLMIFSSMALMGIGCSAGCGTITTPFILGSLLGEGQDISASRKAIALFSVGKVLSLSIMGLLASLFGSIVLSHIETIYPNSTIWVVRIITVLFGVWLMFTALKGRSSKCSSCSSQTQNTNMKEIRPVNKNKLIRNAFYLGTGALYSTIPCAPLITALGYASTMTPLLAMLLLAVFGIVNSIIPVLGFASIVGLANREFGRDLPKYTTYIKISGGIILILAAFFKV